jgi:hypothetical protein
MMETGDELFRQMARRFGSEEAAVKAILRKLGLKRFRFVREFCVVDARGGRVPSPTLIFFVPNGLWHGFDLSFGCAVQKLESQDTLKDTDLAEYICGFSRGE